MVVSRHYTPRRGAGDMATIVATNLRLPQDLYEQIKALAERDNISINAAMIVLLREAVYERSRRAVHESPSPASE